MRLSTEYVLLALLLAAVLAVATTQVILKHAPAVSAPKVGLDVLRSIVVNDGTGVYVELLLASTTNTPICINLVELYSPPSTSIVVGDGRDEVSSLPVCIEPGQTYKLSFYHRVQSGQLPPGSTAIIRLYYSFNTPASQNTGDPSHIMVFSRVTRE